MSAPLRLLVLGCSALSTGELTIALDWVRRCTRAIDLHLLVPATVAPHLAWAGRVHPYPQAGRATALAAMQSAIDACRPDLLLVADLLLFHGAPHEVGASLEPVLHHALARCRVAALDLYDWDAHVGVLECYGKVRFAAAPPLPPAVARLMPSPYLPPGRSASGRGRYAMVSDGQPGDAATKEAVRRELNVEGPLVLTLTSPWQHVAQGLADAAGVTRHFPALMLRLLDEAARRGGRATLVHLGPAPMTVPADVLHLRYVHVAQLPPDRFSRLLGATDLVLTPNCIASSAVRGASMRVPCAALRLDADGVAPVGRGFSLAAGRRLAAGRADTRAQRALAAFLRDAVPLYGFLVWPLGLRRVMRTILQDNPFGAIQAHFDVGDADGTVEGLARLLGDEGARDEIREAQGRYFATLAREMDRPDTALEAIL